MSKKIGNHNYYKYQDCDRMEALKHAFKRHHISDDLTDYGWPLRIFYWLKTVICLLLGRLSGDYLKTNAFEIIWFNQRPAVGENCGYDWQSCWVEPGIFKNWQVCIISDSSY